MEIKLIDWALDAKSYANTFAKKNNGYVNTQPIDVDRSMFDGLRGMIKAFEVIENNTSKRLAMIGYLTSTEHSEGKHLSPKDYYSEEEELSDKSAAIEDNTIADKNAEKLARERETMLSPSVISSPHKKAAHAEINRQKSQTTKIIEQTHKL